jgi:hypothetical protein
MQLLTNHIGYEIAGKKSAILMSPQRIVEVSSAYLICAQTGNMVLEIIPTGGDQIDQWHQGYFYHLDFSQLTTEGRYLLQYQDLQSHEFTLSESVLMKETFSDLLHYFKSQRCSGVYDKKDHHVALLDSQQTFDVHGGWYDASGDVSKYLSHLSYGNFLNPQQIPMVVWSMLKSKETLQDRNDFQAFTALRLEEEAVFGTDFLKRMQHPDGYFFMTVFDKWSKDIEQREICAYETQLGQKGSDYQAGFRQGAGVAIAALAAASRLTQGGEFTTKEYLESAERGYWHLKSHNSDYLNDGVENIIDDYCALLATVELYKATNNEEYLAESRVWAKKLQDRQQSDDTIRHYWSANNDGSRPYFHAAEAGLPGLALCEYLDIEPSATQRNLALTTLNQACGFELEVTEQVFNPFGYPRQYVKGVSEEKRTAFFIAHDNETGYWWQGENARLASLASFAYRAQSYAIEPDIKVQLSEYASNCLNWIVGLNPYDMCMLDGHGYNNPDYLPELGFFNAHGGVCNGITAGFENEKDIAFNPPKQKDDMLQNWRWGEQWIPHAGWLLLAMTFQHCHSKEL